jgi:PAS domain S-box-containing protein
MSKDMGKSKRKTGVAQQPETELEQLRQRVAELEASLRESECVAEALKAKERFYRALIENVSENILVVDAKGKILYVSPGSERIFGYRADYLVGKISLELLHPEDVSRVTRVFNAAVKRPGVSGSIECRYRAGDDSWRYVEAVGTNFLDDPTVGGIVINSRDITERKRAEEALKRSEEYFRALIENSSDGITVLNADGSIRYQSPSVGRLFGYRQQEEVGNPIFKYAHPDEKESIIRIFDHLMKHPGATVSLECRFPAKDGSWGWIEAVSRNLLEDPTVSGVVINYRDITERKQAQQALQESENRQQMAVLEERGRIAREIHDTLAQGLAGIVLQLEAADEVISKDVCAAQEYLDRARSLARESLSEARRSVSDLRPPALEKLSLEESLAREVQKLSQDTGTKATFEILGERCFLSSDVEVGLLRICQEALVNVRRHACATEVEVSLVFEDGFVSLSIRDNGIGFDTEARYEGSYGLMGMRERVRLLGGTLDIRSERGRGSLVEASFQCG